MRSAPRRGYAQPLLRPRRRRGGASDHGGQRRPTRSQRATLNVVRCSPGATCGLGALRAAHPPRGPQHFRGRSTSVSARTPHRPTPATPCLDRAPPAFALPSRERKRRNQWWIQHRKQFPNLEVMARQYLGCPASSASVERLFSQKWAKKSERGLGLRLCRISCLVS